MLKTLALAALLAVGAVLAFAATRPDTFRVERSIVVQAPPQTIYPLLADFRRWTGWSPWEQRDPALKREYSGAARGEGAVYAWEGNREVGTGRMEIVDAQSPGRLQIRLDFAAPFEANNTAEFTLLPEGSDATRVVWAMHGPSPFVAKLMQVFFSMDRVVGADFEAGLANLKRLAEQPQPAEGGSPG